jgi:hypothetical protein
MMQIIVFSGWDGHIPSSYFLVLFPAHGAAEEMKCCRGQGGSIETII